MTRDPKSQQQTRDFSCAVTDHRVLCANTSLAYSLPGTDHCLRQSCLKGLDMASNVFYHSLFGLRLAQYLGPQMASSPCQRGGRIAIYSHVHMGIGYMPTWFCHAVNPRRMLKPESRNVDQRNMSSVDFHIPEVDAMA